MLNEEHMMTTYFNLSIAYYNFVFFGDDDYHG